MDLILEIDYRERFIINEIYKDPIIDPIIVSDNIHECEYFNYKICNLSIGDFILRNKENNTVYYIIERKTINDLCSSISDSRWGEQKERLFDTIKDPCKIIYIIEGSKSNISKFSKINKNTVDSAIQNLILKHQYKVIFSESINDTLDQLILLYKKIKTGALEVKSTETRCIKKSDKLNANIFLNQLVVIPGVSNCIALAITKQYTTMASLINSYNTSPDSHLLLSEIKVTEKRKVGKALSEKIYKSLM